MICSRWSLLTGEQNSLRVSLNISRLTYRQPCSKTRPSHDTKETRRHTILFRLSEAQPYPPASTIHGTGNQPDLDDLTVRSLNNFWPNSFAELDTVAPPCAYNPRHRTARPCIFPTIAGMPALLLHLRSPITHHLPRTTRTRFHASSPQLQRWSVVIHRAQTRGYAHQPQNPRLGTTTPVPDDAPPPPPKSPFYFEAGYALFAKRPSRPFPPPFLSLPSTSFSEPLSTHDKSRDRRPKVNGEMIRGVTNGDDAVLVSDYFIGANDGVGAWATRERGHAAFVPPRLIFTTTHTNTRLQPLVATNSTLLVARS